MVKSDNRRGHWLQPDWRLSTYDDRFREVAPLLAKRTVLDVGAASGHKRPDWMHARIAGVASRVVGIDIDAPGVEAARAKGFDVRLVDAQGADIGERFQVVFAGELIEHLANHEAFMAMARRHLAPGGTFIVTTPNAFALSNFVYRFGGRARIHPEHTCWFCEDTLKALLERGGFEVTEIRYLPHSTPGPGRRLAASAVRAVLPERLAWRTLLAVAR